MATAYSVDKYRDPEKLDISVLGNAMRYKQQNYDTNVAQTQQLINQYAGTDLLREVDKQYFGERLNTLVNYVNQSGTRDWSRRSIANELQSYVSTALDKNVMTAIASTQSYRKQMAEIEDIKKNKPDQYSMQNEWFATQDIQRYMNSGQVGDYYRAQSYSPYTDVKKIILDNASKLKDFGVEYHREAVGGNSYFRQIGTFEKIDPETAKGFLGMMMDTKTMNQLYIDGQYSYKDTNPEMIQEKYNNSLDLYSKTYDDRISQLKLLKMSATKDKLGEYDNKISQLENAKNEISLSKEKKLSKAAMSDYLYRSDFENKWTGFLSYDRLKDVEVDKSGFEIWKAQTDQENQNRNYNLNVDKFKADTLFQNKQLDQKDAQFRAEMMTKGYSTNSDGTYTLDPNNPNNPLYGGLKATDQETELNERKTENVFSKIESQFNSDFGKLADIVGKDLKSKVSKEEYARLKNEIGQENIDDPMKVAGFLVNSPSRANTLLKALSPESRAQLEKTMYSKNVLKGQDEDIDIIWKDAKEIAGAVMSDKTKQSVRMAVQASTFGLTINDNGDVVEGSSVNPSLKYGNSSRLIGVLNSRIMDGNMSNDDIARMKRVVVKELQSQGLNSTKANNVLQKMVYKKDYDGFWSGTGKLAAQGLRGTPFDLGLNVAQGLINSIGGKGTATFADDFGNYSKTRPNRENPLQNLTRTLGEYAYANENINKWDAEDLDTSKLTDKNIGSIGDKWSTTFRNADNKAYELEKTRIGKNFNIDLGSKYGKSVQGEILASLPIGTELQKDSNVQVSLNPDTGVAEISASIKSGKEYIPVKLPVRIQDLPSSLLNRVNLEEKQSMYAASNPYALKYTSEIDLPANRQEWARNVDLLPVDERSNAFNNPPVTQEDMISKLKMAYGTEIVEKNLTEISKIMNEPIQVSTVSENGQWTVVAKQAGVPVFMEPMRRDTYDPDLIEKASNKIATDAIEQRIKQLMYTVK